MREKSVTPAARSTSSSIRNWPWKPRGVAHQHRVRGVGDDLRLAAVARRSTPGNHVDRVGGDHRARPQRVDRDALAARIPRPARASRSSCPSSPACSRCAGPTISDPAIGGGASVRMCGFGACSRYGRQACAQRKLPRALTCCIRSKRFIGVSSVPRSQIALALLTRMSMPPNASTVAATAARTCVLFADVALQRQRAAAGGFDFGRGGVDGAGQLRIGHRGLRRDRDVGAVARRAQRDRQADAARGAGDEQGLAASVPWRLHARRTSCAAPYNRAMPTAWFDSTIAWISAHPRRRRAG